MTPEELDHMLRLITTSEKDYQSGRKQKSTKYIINSKIDYNGEQVYVIDHRELNKQDIFIRKDSRFISMPPHIFKNININYIYSGKCTYCINNEGITLSKGDICFFDRNVIRTKYKTGEDDIIINIVISDQYFREIVTSVHEKTLMASFLSAALAQSSMHNNYIIFKTKNNQRINELFFNLLSEYFQNSSMHLEITKLYFSIIMINLLRLYEDNKETAIIYFSNNITNNLFEIFQYIKANYQSCTLHELSARFGYTDKYICYLLKHYYNTSFKKVQNNFRINEAERLLINSSLSIQEICVAVGFSNRNQFYKHFKEIHHMLPSEYRHQ